MAVTGPANSGSTDQGDLSYIMPTVQSFFAAASGIGHSESCEIADEELAYIVPAKAMVMTCIDLLWDGAAKGIEVKNNYKPEMTKEEYLKSGAICSPSTNRKKGEAAPAARLFDTRGAPRLRQREEVLQMSVSREELKRRACEAVDKNRDKIIAFGESVFAEPELGFKEFQDLRQSEKAFEEMGVAYTDGHAITGVIAPFKGKESKLKVALMGELDAVVCPGHRCADPVTGAAHSCGHLTQIASIIGCGLALKDSGIMDELSGDIVLMGVPAEEGVELEYRAGLIKEGKIHFLGGKQEFIYEGVFDDIDMMIMQHTMVDEKCQGHCRRRCRQGLHRQIHPLHRQRGPCEAARPHLGINAPQRGSRSA